jgi:hypothetical protein
MKAGDTLFPFTGLEKAADWHDRERAEAAAAAAWLRATLKPRGI